MRATVLQIYMYKIRIPFGSLLLDNWWPVESMYPDTAVVAPTYVYLNPNKLIIAKALPFYCIFAVWILSKRCGFTTHIKSGHKSCNHSTKKFNNVSVLISQVTLCLHYTYRCYI